MDKPDTPMKPDKRLILIIDEHQITIPKIQDESYFEDYKIVVFENEIQIIKSKVQYPDDILMMFTFFTLKDRIKNPDQEHFDKIMLKELVWKLDREIWAHVQNPEPSNEWSTSKAREETKKLLIEYLGNSDELKSILLEKEKQIKELEEDFEEMNEVCKDLNKENQELKKEIERLKAENLDMKTELENISQRGSSS